MKNTLESRLGLFFALALIVTVIIIELVGGTDYFKGGYRVNAHFNNVQDLMEGAPVKMAGFPIGRVERIRMGDGKIQVIMKINRDVVIRTDSKASIRFAGLLGQNFVAVEFGSPNAPRLEHDQNITTEDIADLGELMNKLEGVAAGVEKMTKSFSGDGFQNLLGPLTDFMKENSPRIAAILGNMQNISTQMAEGKGTVGKLISDEALYATALATVSNLNQKTIDLGVLMGDATNLLAGARSVMDGVNRGEGTLGKLTKDEALYRESTAAMTNLREILGKINSGQGSVGLLVNDESFYKNAKLTLQKVEKATEGLEDQGPLSVLGIAVNSLF